MATGNVTSGGAKRVAEARARLAAPPVPEVRTLTIIGAAERVGVSPATIRAAIERGDVEALNAGGEDQGSKYVCPVEDSLLAWAKRSRLIF